MAAQSEMATVITEEQQPAESENAADSSKNVRRRFFKRKDSSEKQSRRPPGESFGLRGKSVTTPRLKETIKTTYHGHSVVGI